MQDTLEQLCCYCEEHLNLTDAQLSESYSYDSLPLCVIDAVFSIGVRYTSTKNTVAHYCRHFGLREYNPTRDAAGDRHTISDLIRNIEALGAEQSAEVLFGNHQRTSSTSGILKAEAVLRFAKVLQKYGVERLRDLRGTTLPEEAEREIAQIPGQKSGLALHYFYMLSGDDHWAKPDRHVLRFMSAATGTKPSVQQSQTMLTQAVDRLRPKYPQLTVRLLDYCIWDYMAHGQGKKDKEPSSAQSLEKRVSEIICQFYALTDELDRLLPGRHYTLDGHLVGSIGEAFAAKRYNLSLYPASEKTHDAIAPDGRLVQIKVTQIDRVALTAEPEWLLVLKLHPDGHFTEEYNGPGKAVWTSCGKQMKNGQRQISLNKLSVLQKSVPIDTILLQMK